MSDKDKLTTGDQCVRLWFHEILRVFGDRLVNEEDRLFLFNVVKGLVSKTWMVNFDNVFVHLDKPINGVKDNKVTTLEEVRGLIWTDCMTPIGATKRQYEEILDHSKLQVAVEEQLANYNLLTDKPMDLVLFSFAV